MKKALEKIRVILRVERAVALVWRAGRLRFAGGLGLSVILGLLPIASLYLHKLIIDTITAEGTALDSQIGAVAGFVIVLGVIELGTLLCGQISSYLSEDQSQIVQDQIADRVHAKSIEVDLAYYENAEFQNTLHRAQMLAPTSASTVVQQLGQLIHSGLALAAVFTFLLYFHWGLALFLLLASLPGLVSRLKTADKKFDFQKAHTEDERRAWYFHSVNTQAYAAKEVRVFELGPVFRRWYQELRRKLRVDRMALARQRILVEFLVQAGSAVAQYGGYLYVAVMTVRGQFTLGDLVMFFQAFLRAKGFLQQFMQGLAGLYENNLMLGQLFEFLGIQPTIRSPEHPLPLPTGKDARVKFADVSFSYPGSRRSALEGIHLEINPGEHIAIIGKNGSGKTTLVKLLCRLYEPDQGRITLGDTALTDFDLLEYRRQFSVLFQDYLQHSLTVRENIRLGDTTANVDSIRVEQMAKSIGANEFVQRLPEQYETPLGRHFREGEELSQGQWQKIALARALQRQSGFVILDEPTSSMDPDAEYQIFRQFHELTKGRTAILISHRLNTVRMADRIYVMENGRIVESGSHEELMAHGKRYAYLFETQASGFR